MLSEDKNSWKPDKQSSYAAESYVLKFVDRYSCIIIKEGGKSEGYMFSLIFEHTSRWLEHNAWALFAVNGKRAVLAITSIPSIPSNPSQCNPHPIRSHHCQSRVSRFQQKPYAYFLLTQHTQTRELKKPLSFIYYRLHWRELKIDERFVLHFFCFFYRLSGSNNNKLW